MIWNEKDLMIRKPPPPDSGHTYEPSKWELALFYAGIALIGLMTCVIIWGGFYLVFYR